MKGKGRVINHGKNRQRAGKTIEFEYVQDPETGKLNGIRISGCRACGRYPSLVHSVSGVCGRMSCIRQRIRRQKKAS